MKLPAADSRRARRDESDMATARDHEAALAAWLEAELSGSDRAEPLLLAAFGAEPQPAPAADLSAAILARVAAESPAPARPSWVARHLRWALAAALALCAVAGALLPGSLGVALHRLSWSSAVAGLARLAGSVADWLAAAAARGQFFLDLITPVAQALASPSISLALTALAAVASLALAALVGWQGRRQGVPHVAL